MSSGPLDSALAVETEDTQRVSSSLRDGIAPHFLGVSVILGIAQLLPWNAMLTMNDLFGRLFGDHFLARGTFLVQVSNLGLLVLQIWLTKYMSAKVRTLIAFVIFTLVLAAMVLLVCIWDVDAPPPVDKEWIWSLLFFLSGIAVSFINGGLFELIAACGGEYIGRLMLGQGIAALLAGGSRVVLKFLVSTSDHDLKMQAIVYFGTACVLEVVAAAVFVFSLSFSPKVRRLANRTGGDGSLAGAVAVIRDMLPGPPAVMLIFAVTLNTFPGLITQVRPYSDLSYEWLILIITLTFFVGDIIGRKLISCSCLPMTSKCAGVASLIRLLIPLLLARQAYMRDTVIPGIVMDGWSIALVLILAVSNGYFGTMAMIAGPQCVDEARRGDAGLAMSLSLVIGLLVGTSTGVFWPSSANETTTLLVKHPGTVAVGLILL